MRNALNKLGLALFAIGILAACALVVVGLAYFAIVIAPFFWARGDYLPAVLLLIIGGVVGGGALAALTEQKDAA